MEIGIVASGAFFPTASNEQRIFYIVFSRLVWRSAAKRASVVTEMLGTTFMRRFETLTSPGKPLSFNHCSLKLRKGGNTSQHYCWRISIVVHLLNYCKKTTSIFNALVRLANLLLCWLRLSISQSKIVRTVLITLTSLSERLSIQIFCPTQDFCF